jgi:hypothetical protein
LLWDRGIAASASVGDSISHRLPLERVAAGVPRPLASEISFLRKSDSVDGGSVIDTQPRDFSKAPSMKGFSTSWSSVQASGILFSPVFFG